MRGKRTDANHAGIMRDLRRMGYKVLDLSAVGNGCPDLLVCKARQLMLVELKTLHGRLTPDQQAFQADGWPVNIVHTADKVLTIH